MYSTIDSLDIVDHIGTAFVGVFKRVRQKQARSLHERLSTNIVAPRKPGASQNVLLIHVSYARYIINGGP